MERKKRISVNNAFYDDLHAMWHNSKDHPVALLRAENSLRNPWIQKILHTSFPQNCKILDIGCGGGFLTNFLSQQGHEVVGIDLSTQSLDIAKKLDATKKVSYQRASAYELPFKDNEFDAVCAMDLLEHVENPALVIKEAARVLRKDGLFFFHTFNRNILSYFMIIKGVEWCFLNAPANMHVYPLFIKPKELKKICENQNLKICEITGVRPDFSQKAFWKMIFQRNVDEDFRFIFTPSLKTGYSGYAKKMMLGLY